MQANLKARDSRSQHMDLSWPSLIVLEIRNSSASSKTQKNYTRFLSLDSEGKENRFPKNLPTDTAGQKRLTVTENNEIEKKEAKKYKNIIE